MLISWTPASIPSPRTQHQPAVTCKEHVFGHMIPSVPNHKDIHPVNEEDRRSMSLRVRKLSLCNYAPPSARGTSSISFPRASSPQRSSPSSTTNSDLPRLATLRSSSDEDTASPASSTLSTPSVSPTMAPRVIINGQLATFPHPLGSCEKEDAMTSRPGRIADWDWPAPSKPRIEGLPHQHAGPVPISEPPERRRDIPSAMERHPVADSNSLYHAFITQWCFAQGPPPTHNGYDNGGIMA